MERNFKMHVDNCFDCYKCHKKFPLQKEVALHLKLVHNACAAPNCKNIADFEMHSPQCSNRDFVCVVCQEKFSEKHLLLKHFNKHIDVAYFVCEICRVGFQGRKDLLKHLLEVHDKNTDLPAIPARSKAVYQKCYQCSKYFKLFSEFDEHRSLCDSLTFVCNICKINFTSSCLLESHNRIEHQSNFPVKGYLALKDGKRYFCGMCYLGFFTGDILKEHMKTHETKLIYNCDVCPSNFITDDDLQEHYLQHIEEHYILQDVIQQHSCASCKRMFKTQLQLENHLELGICPKRAWENNSANLVSNTSNEESSVSFNKSDFCSAELVQTLDSNSDFVTLCTVESENYSHCYNENATISSNNENSEPHIENMDVSQSEIDVSNVPVYILKAGDELLNCDDGDCVIVIDQKSVFILQRGGCVFEDRMPDLRNIEAYHENDAIDASLLKTHMLQILYPSEEKKNSNVQDRSYSQIIDETAYQKENDVLHIEDSSVFQTDATLYQPGNCVTLIEGSCNSQTSNPQSFDAESDTVTLEISNENNGIIGKDMLENIYEAVLRGKCEGSKIFDKQLYNIGMIGNTCKIIHENKVPSFDTSCNESLTKELLKETCEPHICNICLQVFSTKISLCLHTNNSHTGFDCFDCGLSFNNEADLSQHEKISHQYALKCGICNASFAKENLLKNHKRSAHEEKQFECGYCSKSYHLDKYYTLHMMKHHSEEISSLKCDKCDKVYNSVSGLRNHKAVHHEGRSYKKNHVCNICDAAFISSLPLKRHIATHMKQFPNNFKCPKCQIYFTQKMLLKHLESHEMISY